MAHKPPPPERIGQPCPYGCGRNRCPGRAGCVECVEERLSHVTYRAPLPDRVGFGMARTFRRRKLVGGML